MDVSQGESLASEYFRELSSKGESLASDRIPPLNVDIFVPEYV